MDVPPERVVLLSLLAVVPAAVHAVNRGDLVTAIAIVNVVLITGSLVYALSGSTGSDGNAAV